MVDEACRSWLDGQNDHRHQEANAGQGRHRSWQLFGQEQLTAEGPSDVAGGISSFLGLDETQFSAQH